MSGTAAGFQNFGVNTLSIISNAQSQLMHVVADFYFDTAGSGVVEGISNHLAANPIDFVLDLWRKPLWLTFDNHMKAGRMPVRRMSAVQFLSDSSQQLREIVLSGWLRPQVVDGIAAFRDGMLSLENCFIESLHRGFRPSRQQVASRLKLKHEAVKTLQQGIV